MDMEKLMSKFEEGFKKIKSNNVKVSSQETQKENRPIENNVNRNNFDLSTPQKVVINKVNVTINLNNEKKGIEISFKSKPSQEVLTQLKSNGFRWHNSNKFWYSKQSEDRFQFAYSLVTNEDQQVEEIQEESTIENEKVENVSLSDYDNMTIEEEIGGFQNV